MLHHRGGEAKAVIGFAEARIIAAGQELINGRAVTIGRVKVAERVPTKAEGIDLAEGVLLDARAIEPKAVGVAGIHFDFRAVLAAHSGVVIEAMRGVNPTIEATAEGRVHAVRVTFPTEWAEKHL